MMSNAFVLIIRGPPPVNEFLKPGVPKNHEICSFLDILVNTGGLILGPLF